MLLSIFSQFHHLLVQFLCSFIVRVSAYSNRFFCCEIDQFLKIAAHSGTEHDCLHLLVAVLHYLLDFGLKTELKQLISLVEYQNLKILYPHASGVHEQIDNSARSSDDQFWIISKG